MLHKLFSIFFLFGVFSTMAQDFELKLNCNLTPKLNETSGLLFFENKLITLNDSGNEPHLYEIDTLTGTILKTTVIKNAKNVDWEDIAQDNTNIYIADIGNFDGTRQDLVIYSISKNDYLKGENVVAQEIKFTYETQKSFTPKRFNSNFDAEAIISFQDKLLLFTKNWENNKVDLFELPKKPGSYIAKHIGEFNSNGLITGADISADEQFIYLIGYSVPPTTLPPFIYCISNFNSNSNTLFSGKIELIPNILTLGNQVEGIAVKKISNTHELFISNEKLDQSYGGFSISIPSKLRTLTINQSLKK